MCRVLAALMTLLVAACAPVEERSAENRSVSPPTEEVPRSADTEQWIQFGMVLSVDETPMPGVDGSDSGMDLNILLDSGETLQVMQPLSQAGRLNQGDRVRVLKIGGYTRVTFWPYGNLSPQGQ